MPKRGEKKRFLFQKKRPNPCMQRSNTRKSKSRSVTVLLYNAMNRECFPPSKKETPMPFARKDASSPNQIESNRGAEAAVPRMQNAERKIGPKSRSEPKLNLVVLTTV